MTEYRRNDISIVVAKLPKRKKPMICVKIKKELYPVASFTTLENAKDFEWAMEELLKDE